MSDLEKNQKAKQSVHQPVLLQEVIDGLNLREGGVYIDGTLGGGGHVKAICQNALNSKIIAIDADGEAIERAKHFLADISCDITFVESQNHLIDQISKENNVQGVDGILLDLGMSSDQLDVSGRGFSFQRKEPLIMSMKSHLSENDLTAEEIVNGWQEESIADILWGYGGEQFSRRIAKAIVESRKEKKIETTFDLVKIIEGAVPYFYKKKKTHPATKTFQALRITVNNEIENLKVTLEKSFNLLNPNGRIAVITFHSLEDKVVKHFFKDLVKEKKAKAITKKPIAPNRDEIINNPRSRSSKLRIIEKI
ncbi:16S rRNA (cytosine(1402)-N(4))-methyltransferase RsmH [Candidatus Nomurabacteria bacterium]|nr:16S rRNA (cytosine(1402)-N(4))-methyltransferase RsmH [Candidatus Nomurabacteria bacterium]